MRICLRICLFATAVLLAGCEELIERWTEDRIEESKLLEGVNYPKDYFTGTVVSRYTPAGIDSVRVEVLIRRPYDQELKYIYAESMNGQGCPKLYTNATGEFHFKYHRGATLVEYTLEDLRGRYRTTTREFDPGSMLSQTMPELLVMELK